MVAGDIEYRAVNAGSAREAQWKTLIRNLYKPTEAGDGAPVDFLHGPN